MDIGALLLVIGVLILVAFYIIKPALPGRHPSTAVPEHVLSPLMAERERLLDALEELDLDHSMGKIPPGEYPAQRAALLQRGASVLRQLDELQKDLPAAPEIKASSQPVSSSPAISDEDLEEMIAKRRTARKEKAAGFCPACGKPVQKSDRYCPACGNELSA